MSPEVEKFQEIWTTAYYPGQEMAVDRIQSEAGNMGTTEQKQRILYNANS